MICSQNKKVAKKFPISAHSVWKNSELFVWLSSVRFALTKPEERKFNENWAEGLDIGKDLRYFSGTEIARFMGFLPHHNTAGINENKKDDMV